MRDFKYNFKRVGGIKENKLNGLELVEEIFREILVYTVRVKNISIVFRRVSFLERRRFDFFS